jgi:hypothetical protein
MKNVPVPSKSKPITLALAAVAAICSVWLAVSQYQNTHLLNKLPGYSVGSLKHVVARPRKPLYVETETGQQMLWAKGPIELEKGEWFDVTGSPLDPKGYQHGIGKDTIPAIDSPEFVAIKDKDRLRAYGIDEDTAVLGYALNGESKAYPIALMNRHELVNDVVGGKPVTVGW